ncbi:MAG: electron transfer flavoprotein subunit beta/FixA family protein [Firmicutes bacterium]|nr:electron transfer flavoprotein subunit beta/FixA family protein [Bacillota bacterium]MCM1400794.1 electron transfer flavoprotein subunit beta/FixA family protein [Bacteroides sp.]MCM1476704.1 electron transfer flavoprotein subunit beta/FixA family protein [Bacteroides sp.]
MSYNIIVLAKQVPDTRNVGKDAMKEDGTINRAALPAIFNPEDLNALEQALRIKDANPGTKVTILTMGLPRASEVIREAMYRGADAGIVLTDRVLGGADTLATSYSLACAVKKFGNYDLILGGRQAIDGDTAQVGPQIAEKLGLPQITYAEEILDITPENITVKRRLENGVETLRAPLPCVVTVNGSAAECRPRNAMRLQQYKYAASTSEKAKLSEQRQQLLDKREYLNIPEWGAAFVEANPEQIGLPGSPTKVKAIENVVFTAKESRCIENNDEQLEQLIQELIANHTIG